MLEVNFYFVVFLEILFLILSILLRILGVSTHVETFTKHGMPSDHAQTIFYFMTFISLVVIFRFTLSPTPHPLFFKDFNDFLIDRLYLHSNKLINMFIKFLSIFGAVLIALLVSFSRIYLEYHTTRQVIAGCLVGFVFGLIINKHFTIQS